MKPIAQYHNNKAIRFHSRLVPGLRSSWAYTNNQWDLEHTYADFIKAEQRYLANGPEPIVSQFELDFILTGKMPAKFSAHVFVAERVQGAHQWNGRSNKRKVLKAAQKQNKRTDIAYRVNVKFKPEAIKEWKAKIEAKNAEKDAEIREMWRRKDLTNLGGQIMIGGQHAKWDLSSAVRKLG